MCQIATVLVPSGAVPAMVARSGANVTTPAP
jgi:hypothetical protein